MTSPGPRIGSSRVLNTVVTGDPVVVGGGVFPQRPINVGDPETGAPSVIGDDHSQAPVDVGGSTGAGTRPVWVGHGPPTDIPDSMIRDLYLDETTYDLYQLGG